MAHPHDLLGLARVGGAEFRLDCVTLDDLLGRSRHLAADAEAVAS